MVCFTELINSNKTIASIAAVFAFVGLIDVLLKAFTFVSMVADLWLLPGKDLSIYGAKKGAWAVITGASDGIGKEYAIQLARKGFNLALISRTESKLATLAKELTETYKIEVKYLAFDATSTDTSLVSSFVKSLKNVTVLVNNVGQSHSIPVTFLETEQKEQNDIIQVNVNTTLNITQIVTPEIIKTIKSKTIAKRGLILTMGSFAGLIPTPMLATYTGSKAFLNAWSSALATELESEKIDVELVISYLVTSAMSKVKRTSLLIPNPKQFVSSTLKTIGKRGGAQERWATNTPYWSHAFLHWAVETFVGVYSKTVSKVNLSMHQDIRRRALKKAERERKNL